MFSNYSFPLQSVTQLSHTDKAYSQSAAALQEFYNYNVHIDNFKQIIDIKKQHYSDEIRQILYDVFLSQYKSISNNNNALNAINLLSKSNTFTVCTAHQPLLFTGAFYFIYKIAAAIKTTIQLSAAYPDCNFIPIYWIGSEDHDFEELNHCFLFNKKISWTDEQGGAVGNYNLNNFQQVIDELQLILGTSTDYNFIINLIKY